MFLPRNVDLNQLAELALSGSRPWSLEVLSYLFVFQIQSAFKFIGPYHPITWLNSSCVNKKIVEPFSN